MEGKHPFRFEKGERVRHSTWRGFVGTILHGTNDPMGLWVKWETKRIGNGDVAPSAWPGCWEIERIDA